MKILLATDGSEFSNEAAGKCCELLSADNDSIIRIISVVETPTPMAAEPFVAAHRHYAEIEADMTKKAEEITARTAALIREKLPEKTPRIQTEVIRGNAKSAIVEDARRFEADLIVVGSHGYGFLERIFLGSVSNAVVQRAHCSVLVVRKVDPDF